MSTLRLKKGTPHRQAVDAAALLSVALAGSTASPEAVAKSSDELRYTLAPVYSPGVKDAHGEHTDAEELRKALWEFNRSTDPELRKLRKQHGDDVVGEIIELYQLPFEHEAELSVAGSVKKTKLPAGTVYAGVQWTEDAWPDVKSGKITGYSMGGTATRIY